MVWIAKFGWREGGREMVVNEKIKNCKKKCDNLKGKGG